MPMTGRPWSGIEKVCDCTYRNSQSGSRAVATLSTLSTLSTLTTIDNLSWMAGEERRHRSVQSGLPRERRMGHPRLGAKGG